MGEPSTSKSNNIIIPSKEDQFNFVKKHWNIHQSKNKRTPLELQHSLKDCPDLSCLDCYPKPITISKDFIDFYQTIIRYQDITAYTGRTVELFEKYNQETNPIKQHQLAITVAVSLAYGQDYWQGTTDLSDIVNLIEAHRKGELIPRQIEEDIIITQTK